MISARLLDSLNKFPAITTGNEPGFDLDKIAVSLFFLFHFRIILERLDFFILFLRLSLCVGFRFYGNRDTVEVVAANHVYKVFYE